MTEPSKRLAIFLPNAGGGGAERSMLKLARGISGRGYTVDLVLARRFGKLLGEVPKSVSVVDLNARRALTSLPGLVRYLRSEQPEALLSVLHTNIIALCAKLLAGVPTRFVVSERSTLSRQTQQYKSDMRMRLMPLLARYLYPTADCITTVSTGVAKDLTGVTGIPSERIRVLYNPIVTPELQEKAQLPLNHPWFEPGEPPVILAVGRLGAEKGFSTLIKAFAQVRLARHARLLILGEGKERAALEALVRTLGLNQDIDLPGFIENPYPYMVRASLFVLSSEWEGLPGALIEALYFGVPVIASDCPSGPREILADGRYGQLVPSGDAAALARAIENGLDGKSPFPSRESWRPFELDTVVNQYIDVLFGS